MGVEYINQLSICGPTSEVRQVTDEVLRRIAEGCKVGIVKRGSYSIKAEWLSRGDHSAAAPLRQASSRLSRLHLRLDWGCANYGIEGLIMASGGKVHCDAKWPEPSCDCDEEDAP